MEIQRKLRMDKSSDRTSPNDASTIDGSILIIWSLILFLNKNVFSSDETTKYDSERQKKIKIKKKSRKAFSSTLNSQKLKFFGRGAVAKSERCFFRTRKDSGSRLASRLRVFFASDGQLPNLPRGNDPRCLSPATDLGSPSQV